MAIDYYAVQPVAPGGGVGMCLTEPGAQNWLQQNAQALVGSLPSGMSYLLSYDEMRHMDSCAACKAANLAPGQLLAQHVTNTYNLYHSLAPSAAFYIWGDMFDPFANAVNNYYFVEGNLAGSWSGVPSKVTIMNWNLANLANSLTWFSGLNSQQPTHFNQVIAGYYDSGAGAAAATQELQQAAGIPGVTGLMYVTWISDYSQLQAFATAAKSNWATYLSTLTGKPSLTSASPASAVQGVTVNAELTGTNFTPGTTVGVSGSGVSAGNITVVSTTQITATLTISAAAVAGTYNISVTTANGTSNTVPFTVTAGTPAPTFTSINPSSGTQGTSVPLTLNGTGFTAGSQVRLDGSAVPFSNVTVSGPTRIAATLNLAANLAIGAHNVDVLTSAGDSNTLAFTVTAPAGSFGLVASPASVSVAQGANGTSAITTTVSGGFNSAIALSASGQPAGVTVSFNPASIAAPGSGTSTMTMVVASTAAAGSYTITVTGTGTSTTHTSTVTLIVTSVLRITTASLPNGLTGVPYSAVLTAVGGTPPHTWVLTSRRMPAGLTLNAQTGQISGTPTAAVTNMQLTFNVTDSTTPAVQTATVNLTLTITSATLTITTVSLPNGLTGVPYSAVLAAVGGTAPYTWALTSRRMPAGLTLNAQTGQISGTPTSVTSTPLTFNVNDSTTPTAQSATVSLTLTVTSATLTVTTASLPNGQTGAPYSAILGAVGGTTPYTWALASRTTLPAGLTLNAQTGQISGTPTSVTSTPLTFNVTDSTTPTAQTAMVSFTLTITSATLTVTSVSLPNGQPGVPYSAMLTAAGGTMPYSWQLASGLLPAGLTLNGETGQISGTPTAGVTSTPLTIKVSDSTTPTAQTAMAGLTLTIASGTLTITTTSLPNGQTGVPYSAVLTAVGGAAPYTWILTSRRMPAGLTLNAQTGQISGTPTSGTNSVLTFSVTDSTMATAQTATVSLTLNIM